MSGLKPHLVKHEEVGFLLVITQPRAAARRGELEPILVRLEHLLMFADWAAVPLIAAALHEKGIENGLHERLQRVFPGHGQYRSVESSELERDGTIMGLIVRSGRGAWAVAGGPFEGPVVEFVARLMALSYTTYLLEDCLLGASGQDAEQLYEKGAVPSTLKSLYYELKRDVDGSGLPPSWHERKDEFRGRFTEPEKWPPLRLGA